MTNILKFPKGGEYKAANQETEVDPEIVSMLASEISKSFVRKDSKFFATNRLGTKLSEADVERACLTRFIREIPEIKDAPTYKEAFERAIRKKHGDFLESIPVWNGSTCCQPGNDSRIILDDLGMVSVNTWKLPAYRRHNVKPTLGKAGEFFDALFTREKEKEKFLDWLAWCLQHEESKPNWAPFLYSKQKGSGKSTLTELVARLFGKENSVTQNNVDKLTAQFNSTVLLSKLVVCEEVNLPAGSPKSNALKTFITEETVMLERKGQEAEAGKQCCCFLFTSNHLPFWIEEHDRRYYLIEIDHDGHANGPKAQEFASLVGRLKEEMESEEFLAAVHSALMQRKLADGFSAKTLNVNDDATPLSKRVHGASEQAIVGLMREHLAEKGARLIPEREVARIISDELKGNPARSKHIMSELEWSKEQRKWGGKDYTRAIWIEKGFWIEKGVLKGPNGFSQVVNEHLKETEIGHL